MANQRWTSIIVKYRREFQFHHHLRAALPCNVKQAKRNSSNCLLYSYCCLSLHGAGAAFRVRRAVRWIENDGQGHLGWPLTRWSVKCGQTETTWVVSDRLTDTLSVSVTVILTFRDRKSPCHLTLADLSWPALPHPRPELIRFVPPVAQHVFPLNRKFCPSNRDVDPVLVQCWASVYDPGPTLSRPNQSLV